MLLLVGLACHSSPPSPVPLRWVRGYEGDDWSRSERGLYWQLTQLGATPPADGSALEVVAADADGAQLLLHLDRLGLPGGVAPELHALADDAARSDEAARFGGVDLGRFLLLAVYDPQRYYAVTGVPEALSTWEDRFFGDRALLRYDVTESLVSFGDRVVWIPPYDGVVTSIGIAAVEDAGTEVLDVMENGQIRYASYDRDGRRVAALDPAESPTGLPGKCMWCHEEGLHVVLGDNVPGPGSLSTEAFLAELGWRQAGIDAWREALGVRVDWAAGQEVHGWGELLTETFLAPSPARLAREWGWTEEEVRGALGPEALEVNPEYPEHGEVTTRAWADAVFAAVEEGFAPLPVPESAREP